MYIRYGVTANIAAFHAAARGSIPRIGIQFFLVLLLGSQLFSSLLTNF